MSKSESIGFIGLGIMGRAMARNLMAAGHQLTLYARRADAAAALVDAGARLVDTPAEVARATRLIVSVVSDTPDVEAVLLGPNGVIEGVRPGSIVADMSTISPCATRDMARRFRALDVAMLDAPVSGGEAGAKAGTLSIMVGGDPQAFARMRPLFEIVGQHIVHVGPSGAGQVCKSCNQIVVGATIAGVAEAILLAQASGVDPAKVREALLGGFAASRVLEVHGQRMIESDYRPGFKAKLHQKDMRIVMESANALGLPLSTSAIVSECLNALVGGGGGEEDSSAMFKVIRQRTNPP